MTDLTQMTAEELQAHVRHLHSQYMFHQAAERGYDHEAAQAAFHEYADAKAELELRKCRTQAEPVRQAIELLVGSMKD